MVQNSLAVEVRAMSEGLQYALSWTFPTKNSLEALGLLGGNRSHHSVSS